MFMEAFMTIIVADTTCSLPRDLLAQRGIPTFRKSSSLGKMLTTMTGNWTPLPFCKN
jgi:hypothetical protein